MGDEVWFGEVREWGLGEGVVRKQENTENNIVLKH